MIACSQNLVSKSTSMAHELWVILLVGLLGNNGFAD